MIVIPARPDRPVGAWSSPSAGMMATRGHLLVSSLAALAIPVGVACGVAPENREKGGMGG